MTYVAFYAALILPVVSLVSTLVLRGKFLIAQELSASEVAKGEALRYVFTLRNNSFLLCTNVQVLFDADNTALDVDMNGKHFPILPYKSRSFSFDIGTRYRGVYNVGVNSITIYDFLGLFRFRQPHTQKLEFVVNPAVRPLPSLPISSAALDAAEVHNFLQDENYSVISDLRKYQPTDGYKKIHWKLSAKKGELISKNFQATRQTSIALIIENSYITGARDAALVLEDSMVEALVSVMAYVSGQGHPLELYYMGTETGDAESGSFDYLYKLAAELRFGEFGRFDDFFSNIVSKHADASSAVLFVQDITDGSAAAVKTMLMFGCNVIVLVFSDNEPSLRRGIAQLEELGAQCIFYGDLVG